jgi:hypothetical protein
MLSPIFGDTPPNLGTKVIGYRELKPLGSPSAKFKIIFDEV